MGKYFTNLAIVLFCLSVLFIGPVWAKPQKVLLLQYFKAEPINLIVSEIETHFKAKHPDMTLEVMSNNDIPTLVNKVTTFAPDLILLVGAKPLDSIRANSGNTPIVVSDLVLPSKVSKVINENTALATLDIALELRAQYVTKMIPTAKTISVVYNTTENGELIEKFSERMSRKNITVKKLIISSEKDIVQIKSFDADVLLIIPDSITCRPMVLKYLMPLAAQQKVPMIGLSRAFAQMGTLFALEPDYKRNAWQVCEVADRIINGEKPGEIGVVEMDHLAYFINLSIAKYLDIHITKDIIDGAEIVFGK